MPTRLELHRAKFNRDNRQGPMLVLASLSDEESKLLIDDLFSRMRQIYDGHRSPVADDTYRVYAKVLSDWGVMCPHPLDRRLYDGSKFYADNENFRWYDCTMCCCAVINAAWKGEAQPFRLPKPRPALPVVRNTPPRGNGAA